MSSDDTLNRITCPNAGKGDRGDEPASGREETPTGVLTKVSLHLRRLVAPNPSAFTFTGTCTYIVGEGEVVAALSVTGLSYQLNERFRRRAIQQLDATVSRLSAQLRAASVKP